MDLATAVDGPTTGLRAERLTEEAAMTRAIRLATDPVLRTGRNPRVGCVLLDDSGRVVGQGAHHGPGTPHAEVAALQCVSPEEHVHTAVVTLEPCGHHGLTPPCVEALVRAGVRRVVFGVRDPDPVAGGGALQLRRLGIDVVAGVRRDACAAVDPAWLAAARLGRPHVTWKVATTLDGRVAARDGSSRWISSAASRRHAHRLRAASDCVMVGSGTVEADDPRLTVRGTPGPQPLRVVVGHRGIPPRAAVRDDRAELLHITSRQPHHVLQTLWDNGVRRVLLEGGPTLAGGFVGAGLVDRVVAYVAPKLLGAGPAALGDAGIGTLAQALDLRIDDVRRLGDDVLLDATIRRDA